MSSPRDELLKKINEANELDYAERNSSLPTKAQAEQAMAVYLAKRGMTDRATITVTEEGTNLKVTITGNKDGKQFITDFDSLNKNNILMTQANLVTPRQEPSFDDVRVSQSEANKRKSPEQSFDSRAIKRQKINPDIAADIESVTKANIRPPELTAADLAAAKDSLNMIHGMVREADSANSLATPSAEMKVTSEVIDNKIAAMKAAIEKASIILNELSNVAKDGPAAQNIQELAEKIKLAKTEVGNVEANKALYTNERVQKDVINALDTIQSRVNSNIATHLQSAMERNPDNKVRPPSTSSVSSKSFIQQASTMLSKMKEMAGRERKSEVNLLSHMKNEFTKLSTPDLMPEQKADMRPRKNSR